ncbi:hypothetical protein TWF718_005355 [Orbilia javanica]|uniref:CCHC-type domain-containing protein n=1 Tax=Orbilia javanica TaxID=47235 RepID=A0AAN8RIS2_9PEZI
MTPWALQGLAATATGIVILTSKKIIDRYLDATTEVAKRAEVTTNALGDQPQQRQLTGMAATDSPERLEKGGKNMERDLNNPFFQLHKPIVRGVPGGSPPDKDEDDVTPTPPNAPIDDGDYLEPARPFLFAGGAEIYWEWSTEVFSYIAVNEYRLGDMAAVLYEMRESTQIGSLAHSTISSLLTDINNPESENAKTAIEFLDEIWCFEAKLRYDRSQIMPFVHSRVRPTTKYRICQWLKKDEPSITWEEYWEYGPRVEALEAPIKNPTPWKRKTKRAAPKISSGEPTSSTSSSESKRNTRIREIRTEWSDEDYRLIRSMNWCLGCGFAGHFDRDCRNKSKPGGWSKVLGPKQRRQSKWEPKRSEW